MTRLNKSIREKIVAAAVGKSGVTSREKALCERRAKLADDCRVHFYGGKDSVSKIDDVMSKIAALEELLPSHTLSYRSTARRYHSLDVNFGGLRTQMYYNGAKNYDDGSNNCVYKKPSPRNRVDISSDHDLCKEFHAIEKESKIVKDLRDSVEANVTAAVNAVSTIKKLLEQWPEAEELLPEAEAVKAVPVVKAQQLNAMIGLPS